MIFDKVGGRKFVLALIAVAVGAAVDLLTERGLSQSLGMLLGGIVAAFSVTNMAVKYKLGVDKTSDLVKPEEQSNQELIAAMQQSNEAGQQFIQELNQNLTEIKEGQKAQAEQMGTVMKGITTVLTIRGQRSE